MYNFSVFAPFAQNNYVSYLAVASFNLGDKAHMRWRVIMRIGDNIANFQLLQRNSTIAIFSKNVI